MYLDFCDICIWISLYFYLDFCDAHLGCMGTKCHTRRCLPYSELQSTYHPASRWFKIIIAAWRIYILAQLPPLEYWPKKSG